MKKLLVVLAMLFLASCGAENAPVVDDNGTVDVNIEENTENFDELPPMDDTNAEESVDIEVNVEEDTGSSEDSMNTEEDSTIMEEDSADMETGSEEVIMEETEEVN